MILPPASGVSNEGRSSPLLVLAPPFLGPGFRLGARRNRLGEAVKTHKKREKTGKKWARYGLRSVNKEGRGGITWRSGGGGGERLGLLPPSSSEAAARSGADLSTVSTRFRNCFVSANNGTSCIS